MSTNDPPSYLEQGSGVKVYHLHTPFNPHVPQESLPGVQQASQQTATEKPRFTTTEQLPGSHLEAETGKKNYVKYDVGVGRSPTMMNCSSCHKEVETVVTYKAGTYAWLMCLLFICCGLVLCCCLIPFFLNSFKDAHHSCPICHRVLHIEKKKCCE